MGVPHFTNPDNREKRGFPTCVELLVTNREEYMYGASGNSFLFVVKNDRQTSLDPKSDFFQAHCKLQGH